MIPENVAATIIGISKKDILSVCNVITPSKLYVMILTIFSKIKITLRLALNSLLLVVILLIYAAAIVFPIILTVLLYIYNAKKRC